MLSGVTHFLFTSHTETIMDKVTYILTIYTAILIQCSYTFSAPFKLHASKQFRPAVSAAGVPFSPS